MVARGDLAVEVGNAVVPGLQKRMIRMAREHNKLTITATQMMESMIHNPVPTRAEVSDVANAVIDQSIAMATLFTASHLKVKAIAALTQSGSTALWISRHNCDCPIYALTSEIRSLRRMSLYRNVSPLPLEQHDDRDELLQSAEDLLLATAHVQRGDLIVLTVGEPIGKSGGTNTMKIVRVGEHRA